MTDTTIPKCIIKELDSLKKQTDRVNSVVPLVKFGETLIDKFKDTPGTSDWRVSVGFEYGTLQGVTVHVTALDINTLIAVRKFIRTQGFPLPEEEEYPEIHRKSWEYQREGEEVFRLSFHTSYDEGAVCKYVKVGTKQEDVFELQCNGAKVLQEV